MCLQCTSEMLRVGGKNNPHRDKSGFYVGIAREDYLNYIREGDVLIGEVNDPYFVISNDLFTKKEWDQNQDLEKDDIEWVDDFAWDEGNIFFECEDTWWRSVPRIVKRFEETFGPCPSNTESCWPAYVVTTAARLLQEREIPLDVEGRTKWANQFPLDINSITMNKKEGQIVFEMSKYVEVEKGEYEEEFVEWNPSNQSSPKELL